MNAGNSEVEPFVIGLIEVERSLCIQDVQLRSKQETKASHLSRNYMKVAKIDGVASSGNAWSMLRNPQNIKAFLLSGSHHFLQRTISMTAHNGVSVNVK